MVEKAELAHRLCESGKFHEALQILKELERDSDNPSRTAGYLIDEATCYTHNGNSKEAQRCVDKARALVGSDPLSSAQIDYFVAISLIEGGQQKEGVQALSRIAGDASRWLGSNEGRELYERVQVERGFTLMHIPNYAEARPLLEEALSFKLQDDVKSSLHCHLGRCYHELGKYDLAKEQFTLAEMRVPEDWEDAFHYYYGYTLYRLKDFDAARREFIMSLQSGSSGPPASYKYGMLAETYWKLGEHRLARQYEDLAKKAQLSSEETGISS